MLPVANATTIEQISRAADPKKAIIQAVGDLSGCKISADLVLVGTYIRSEKTAGGIYRPNEVLKEDEYQGKVGLVLYKGPLAYGDWEADDERGKQAALHTWVVYAIKDGWPVQINGTACRFVPYDKIRMQIPNPAMVF